MKLFARGRAVKELEMIYHELCQYLSNNYKEPAHRAREKLSLRTEELFASGALAEKDYQYYRNLSDEYARKMIDYHH